MKLTTDQLELSLIICEGEASKKLADGFRYHIAALDEEIAELQKVHVSEMEEALNQHTIADRLRAENAKKASRISELEAGMWEVQRIWNNVIEPGQTNHDINAYICQLLSPKGTHDSNLHKKLDELALRPRITRKVSTEKTDETPNWSEYESLWMESDEQLRARIKDATKDT